MRHIGDAGLPRSEHGRRAISVPLTPVIQRYSRSLTDPRNPRSARMQARTPQLPKLIVRVRFPSPALLLKAGFSGAAAAAYQRITDELHRLDRPGVVDELRPGKQSSRSYIRYRVLIVRGLGHNYDC